MSAYSYDCSKECSSCNHVPSGFSGATSLASPKLSSPFFLIWSRTSLNQNTLPAANLDIWDSPLALLQGRGLHPCCAPWVPRSPEPRAASQHAGKQAEQTEKQK